MEFDEFAAGLAIAQEARRLEDGLRNQYADWGVSATFDETIASICGEEEEWGVDSKVLEEVEQKANETNLETLAALGDELPIAMLKLSYALSIMATHLAYHKEITSAWEQLAAGIFWHGQLVGRELGLWEAERRQRAKTVAQLTDGRHRENRSCRAMAMIWYDAHRHEFKSEDDIAFAIAGKVVPMKFRAVREWITEHKKLKK